MIVWIRGFFWRHYLAIAQTVAVIVVAATLLVFASSLYQIYDRRPAVHLISLDPANLGSLCPGNRFVISSNITVIKPALITYYVSVMNKTQEKHLIGTQEFFRGLPYPVAGKFFQSFPWIVPKLPAGKYARILAASDTSGINTPEIVVALFSVRGDCQGAKNGF